MNVKSFSQLTQYKSVSLKPLSSKELFLLAGPRRVRLVDRSTKDTLNYTLFPVKGTGNRYVQCTINFYYDFERVCYYHYRKSGPNMIYTGLIIRNNGVVAIQTETQLPNFKKKLERTVSIL